MTTQEAILFVVSEDKNANQYRLSKALGVSKQAVNHWIKGRSNMRATTYVLFKRIYPDVVIDDVFDDEQKELGLKR